MTNRIASLTRISIIAVITMTAALFLVPKSAEAGIRISPPKFDYVVYPGDVIQDVVSLTNDDSVGIELFPAVLNFTAQEGDETSGSPATYPADEVRTGTELGTWIDISAAGINVAANGRANVPFTIRIPEDATPGGHFGMIELTLQSPRTEPGVGVSVATGALIFIRVEGDIVEKMRVDQFASDDYSYSSLPVNFNVRLVNEGNTHIRPVGHIFIKNMFGRQVKALSINPNFQTILPDSARRFNESWIKRRVKEDSSELKKQLSNFAFGKYEATLVLNYGADGQIATATYDFIVLPWLALLVWLGGGLLLLLVLIFGLKAYNKSLINRYEKKKSNE